jgi:predicted RNase H-like HicB family nuclease
MLSEYLDKKLKQARFKRLADRSYFGEIPSARGVWANARTLAQCRNELKEVLEDWLLLKIN